MNRNQNVQRRRACRIAGYAGLKKQKNIRITLWRAIDSFHRPGQ
jgi:hypothetical protein